MQQALTEHPSQAPVQYQNQPQMQQSIQPSMQSIQPSMQSIQSSMQSIQPSMQTIQQSMQSIQQPMQSIQQSMQSIQPSMQSIHPSMQSIQQPMMLCPVQFVYETQMLMPQRKTDEQIQQNTSFPPNTYVINVQNPPPWIQNRNMNQIVYMPQLMPNNIQPYVQQHMVQNPMFIQQFQQPMPEQMRMQIPHLIQQNMVQNQNVIQNTQNMMRLPQMEIKQEKMPLLSQMLQEQATQGVRKANQPMQNDLTQIQIMRPTYQSIRPQMLTVNPMPSNHTCAHHTSQAQAPNLIREQNQIVTEIPPHIRNQIPEGLSVKSIYKPVPMTMVRPNEYLQNIAPANTLPSNIPNLVPRLIMKNTTTNTDNRNTYKRKSEITKADNENVVFKKPCTQLEEDTAKLLCKMKNDAIANKMKIETQVNKVVDAQPEKVTVQERLEEKPIRNTVFVQARGRINESVVNVTHNHKNEIIQPEDIANQNDSEHNVVTINKEINPDFDRNSPAQVVTVNPPKENTIHKDIIDKDTIDKHTIKDSIDRDTRDRVIIDKDTIDKDIIDKDTTIEKDIIDKDNITNKAEETTAAETKSEVMDNTNARDRISQFVLTHVLDGHIIQESNIPFSIKKPSQSPKKLTSHNNTGETEVSFNSLKETNAESKETAPNMPSLDNKDDATTTIVNEDNPFENIRRVTVKSWTVSDLFSHLHHHNWRETAQKLRDEEIDGESLLLVSREQLLNVGVDDCRADVICSFLDIVS